MRRMKRVKNSVSILMALLVWMISTPTGSVFAVMIGTGATVSSPDTAGARVQLRSFLDRQDVQSALTARGIDPAEAKARVDSLSDAEVMQIAEKIDGLPAGGDFWGTFFFVVIVVFLTLLVLEILGYTDLI